MPLKGNKIIEALRGDGRFNNDKLAIVPSCEGVFREIETGSVSIDLRLGRWFISMKQSSHTVLDPSEDTLSEEQLCRKHFVRFDDRFILHPRSFILGSTLEWIRMPSSCSGSIVGKSSLGRRGLIIETAPIVHPGFAGCLTLELANVGDLPIALCPGMQIAQLVIDYAEGDGCYTSRLSNQRRPSLGTWKLDPYASRIRRG